MELSMFSERARKPPPTLVQVATRSSMNLITSIVEHFPTEDITYQSRKIRKYIRQRLPFNLLSDIFKRFLPTDPWTHPCSHPVWGNACKIHQECQLIYSKLAFLIKILFSEDIQEVNVDFRKVKPNTQGDIIESFTSIFTKIPVRDFLILHTFIIRAAGKIDENLVKVEELASQLKEKATNLQVLHLPVASNIVLIHVSEMKNLRVFKSDRSKHLNGRGILRLAAKDSISKYKLEVLHIGIFKHPAFWKENVCGLLRFMENLKEFSFRDADRMILRNPWQNYEGKGDKVLTYSVFKLAIKRHERKHDGRIGPEHLATDLREIIIVDKVLKPVYLLESAPKLTSLIIDWQENIRPSHEMPADWFKDMIRKESWRKYLAPKLTKLSITFPAAYLPNTYSLPPQDFNTLMNDLTNLTSLHLKGAGMNGPFPLLPVLRLCPLLTELVLEKTPIHAPNEFEAIREEYRHRNLVKFHLNDELSSLTFHQHLTNIIAIYMPELEELEIMPANAREFKGFTLDQILKLSALKKLKKLGITFSTSDCTSNMPATVYILKEFHELRHLVISWGAMEQAFDGMFAALNSFNNGYPVHLMTWLQTALEANNSNINLQLSIKHHHQEYSCPTMYYYSTSR